MADQNQYLAQLLFGSTRQAPTPNALGQLVGDAAYNYNRGIGAATPVTPTWRERAASILQNGIEKVTDRYNARKIAETLMGGQNSNLPMGMGLADVTPLGALFGRQESPNMGPGAPSGLLSAASLPMTKPAAKMAGGHEIDAVLSSSMIEPPHSARDKVKLSALIDEMKSGGWQGRPVLAIQSDNGAAQAITGSHRIAAAKKSGVEIPVQYVDRSKIDQWFKNNNYSSSDFFALDDFYKQQLFQDIGDSRAARLMGEDVVF